MTQTHGEEILQMAREWSRMLDLAPDGARIGAIRERMNSPQPDDMVVEASLLDPEVPYSPFGVGVYVESTPNGTALIRLCDDMTGAYEIAQTDLVAVPGLGRGWPR